MWRLEVMPDAIQVRDPFTKASPAKTVTRIQWQAQPMQIQLPDLGNGFRIKGINKGNNYDMQAKAGGFAIRPGTYLLTTKNKGSWNGSGQSGTIQLDEFVAPEPTAAAPFVVHEPYNEITAGQPFTVKAKVVGIDASAKVTLQMNNTSAVWKTILMEHTSAYTYQAEAPADIATPGLINYKIIVQRGDSTFYTFPGNHKGNPFAWDYYQDDTWQTFVAAPSGALEIFNATTDRDVYVYPNLWKGNERQLITAAQPGQLILRLAAKELSGEHVLGWQYYFADKVKGRQSVLASFDKLVVKARTDNTAPVQVKVSLISDDASAYTAYITVNNNFQQIEIPLRSLKPTPFILLPRPYPGFRPLWFKPGSVEPYNLSQAEKLEITIGNGLTPAEARKPYSLEVESVWLEKAKP